MSRHRVLSVSLERYIEICDAKKIHYRAAVYQYILCLKSRNLAKERHFPLARRRQTRALRALLDQWIHAYADWRMTITGPSTAWNDLLGDNTVRLEQSLWRVDNVETASFPAAKRRYRLFTRRFSLLLRRADPKKVNTWGTGSDEDEAVRFPLRLRDLKAETKKLRKLAPHLQDRTLAVVVDYLKQTLNKM